MRLYLFEDLLRHIYLEKEVSLPFFGRFTLEGFIVVDSRVGEDGGEVGGDGKLKGLSGEGGVFIKLLL